VLCYYVGVAVVFAAAAVVSYRVVRVSPRTRYFPGHTARMCRFFIDSSDELNNILGEHF
jgi:hypothetical protein